MVACFFCHQCSRDFLAFKLLFEEKRVYLHFCLTMITYVYFYLIISIHFEWCVTGNVRVHKKRRRREEMGSAKYSLRWNNHQAHLLNAFEGLLHNETLVDVTLVCQETTFKAHKVVLSACRCVDQIFYFGLWLTLPHPAYVFIILWVELRNRIWRVFFCETYSTLASAAHLSRSVFLAISVCVCARSVRST